MSGFIRNAHGAKRPFEIIQFGKTISFGQNIPGCDGSGQFRLFALKKGDDGVNGLKIHIAPLVKQRICGFKRMLFNLFKKRTQTLMGEQAEVGFHP